MTATPLHIVSHDPIGVDARLLRLQRPDWEWEAGQLVGILGRDRLDQRDYTIASGTDDPTLDVLYRIIPHGSLTPFLAEKVPGDVLHVEGPYGRFTLPDPSRPVLFCATGTGIAPCRAFLRTHPQLALTLLHGVRTPDDLYFRDEWRHIHYLPFCSREPLDGITARLTDVLPDIELEPGTRAYLCGGNEMIYEAEEILKARGLQAADIFMEPYYYRAYDA